MALSTASAPTKKLYGHQDRICNQPPAIFHKKVNCQLRLLLPNSLCFLIWLCSFTCIAVTQNEWTWNFLVDAKVASCSDATFTHVVWEWKIGVKNKQTGNSNLQWLLCVGGWGWGGGFSYFWQKAQIYPASLGCPLQLLWITILLWQRNPFFRTSVLWFSSLFLPALARSHNFSIVKLKNSVSLRVICDRRHHERSFLKWCVNPGPVLGAAGSWCGAFPPHVPSPPIQSWQEQSLWCCTQNAASRNSHSVLASRVLPALVACLLPNNNNWKNHHPTNF